ncbi:Protein timeless like protein [Eufriesea mexicana]|uniref:Protein timeless like protein n=1 Tax=Eufriesea mexicana TaxID=516756 RepID=A0A310SSD2_9HYME|nr:Protein timeless like protein [Eufriesea mexicana]
MGYSLVTGLGYGPVRFLLGPDGSSPLGLIGGAKRVANGQGDKLLIENFYFCAKLENVIPNDRFNTNSQNPLSANNRFLGADVLKPILQIPNERSEYAIYQKLVAYTQAYKVALTDDRIWAVLSNRLSKILKLETAERGEEKEMIIERILIFIRNVLQIPPDENENRVDNDVTIHDEVLFALNASGVVDLLLFIASNRSEQQYHLQVLEIVSLMLRDQNASQLAKSGLQRSVTEKEKDEATLLSARLKEKERKTEKIRKYAGARHSHFGGTYVVQNMKAIGENQLLCHKPYQKVEALNFSQDKKKVSKPKNKRPMSDPRNERTSALSVRLFLKEFCMEFLNAAYNPVMKYARSCMIAAAQGEQSEATCYLWSLRFFMDFNRHYKFDVKYVSETISTEIFHLVQRQMEFYNEMIVTDKKKIPVWSRRLHLGLKAYQELLYTLMAMDQSADRGVRESSKVIKSNVFYVPEYRETILSQLLAFDEVKMSRQYLIDLVTTVHVFLKLLSNYCGRNTRNIMVQEVKRKRQKGGTRKKKTAQKEQLPARSLEERWDEISPQLSVVMKEGTIPEVVPFDATLDVPIDDQKVDAMKKIQKLLRSKLLEQAVGLIRAASSELTSPPSFVGYFRTQALGSGYACTATTSVVEGGWKNGGLGVNTRRKQPDVGVDRGEVLVLKGAFYETH